MLKVIGDGAHGVVGKMILDGKFIAVKKLSSEGRSHSHFLLEVSIMCTYDHPYLNKCIKVEREQDNLLLFQELAEWDLSKYIRSTMDLSEDRARSWTRCIASALSFLKDELIVHGDIKPANILVYSDLSVKLADFGCCAMLENEYIVATSGTTRYSSPETIMKSILSYSSDIWSLGCVIYEMLTRTALLPSCKKGDSKQKYRIVKSIQAWRRTCGDTDIDKTEDLGALRALPLEFYLDGSAGELVNSMLRYHSSKRITLEEVLDSNWLGVGSCQHNANICCSMLNTNVLVLAINHIESYIAFKSLVVPDFILRKASNIYSRTTMKEEVEIEASLVIAQRMFRSNIKDYHPTSGSRILEKKIVEIMETNRYRTHKYSMNELFVKLGK